MPKHGRQKAAAADSRPAFNRPPGAKAAAAHDESSFNKKRPSREDAKRSSAVPLIKDDHPRRQSRTPNKSSPVKGSPTKRSPTRDRSRYNSSTSLPSSRPILSVDSLAKLNSYNERTSSKERLADEKRKEKQYRYVKEKDGPPNRVQKKKRKKNRDVSGAILEEGRADEKHGHQRRNGGAASIKEIVMRRRGGEASQGGTSSRLKRFWIIAGIIALLLIIIIPVAVVVGGKNSSKGNSTNSTSNGATSNAGLNGMSENDIPAAARGTIMDPFTWVDTTDFNVTYTNETVGGLSVMGLHSSWDDSQRANPNVPPVNGNWSYGQVPIRGVNIGGWLSLEPFITPSLFNPYSASDNVVDEYNLCLKLGPHAASSVLEKHYATFVTEQTFIDIANAGLDHVRIPFPYWCVTTYDGDPYVPKLCWRYLLRAIEWARKHGLRVNLDLHSVPGSQNGWNHSGRSGVVNWLNGTDGALNGQRSLDIHNQLSQFFAQPRYEHVVVIYGLVNEPRLLSLPIQPVLDWSAQAVQIVRRNGVKQYIAFGDGFLGLSKWDNLFKNVDPGLIMDTHQYVIFNSDQLAYTHQNKINMACSGWTGLLTTSNNPATG